MFRNAGEHLACRDRCIKLLSQRGVSFGVVAIERLLYPDQVELLEAPAHALRGRAIPLLIGVNHQREVITQMFAHGRDAVQIERPIGLTHFQLDAADALLAGHIGVVQQLLQGRVQEAA